MLPLRPPTHRNVVVALRRCCGGASGPGLIYNYVYVVDPDPPAASGFSFIKKDPVGEAAAPAPQPSGFNFIKKTDSTGDSDATPVAAETLAAPQAAPAGEPPPAAPAFFSHRLLPAERQSGCASG